MDPLTMVSLATKHPQDFRDAARMSYPAPSIGTISTRTPPEDQQLNFNLMGQFSMILRNCGIDVAVRNQGGSFVAACLLRLEDVIQSDHAEVTAAKDAMKLARQLNVRNYILEKHILWVIS